MEATVMEPATPGSGHEDKGAGEHVHQLLVLAQTLSRAASGSAHRVDASLPLGVDVGTLTDREAAAWAQTLGQLSRHLQGLMVQVAGELAERVTAGRYEETGARTATEYLSSSLRLGRGEANNRLRLAGKLLPASEPLTQTVAPPEQAILAAAFFGGKVSVEQALVVSGFVERAGKLEKAGTASAADVISLEETLSDHAKSEPSYFLRHVGTRALALLDPDGEKPSESERLAKQGLFFHRPYKGWIRIDGYLTISQYE